MLSIHTDISETPEGLSIAYFKHGYFQSQAYDQFIGYSSKEFFISFEIAQKKAISIPRSPFGSFFCRNSTTMLDSEFKDFVVSNLKERGATEVELRHPSTIYDSFVNASNIAKNGFEEAFADINQHIELNSEWESTIHNMQKRKLESLRSEGFAFRKMERSEFETAHKFLTICRQAQGLQINISWDQLKHLTEQLPNSYECFGVFRDDKISALCIAVNVSPDVAYYYLPGTSPMFRDKSPMVMLIGGMVDYYLSKGFKYLDLGVSSFQGKAQETLRIFKERMGAAETPKPTFTKTL